MIKIESKGERVNIEVAGTMQNILSEFSYLASSLAKKGVPKDFLRIAFKLGLENKEDDEKDELEEKKEIVKELLQRMKEANQKEFEENNKKDNE